VSDANDRQSELDDWVDRSTRRAKMKQEAAKVEANRRAANERIRRQFDDPKAATRDERERHREYRRAMRIGDFDRAGQLAKGYFQEAAVGNARRKAAKSSAGTLALVLVVILLVFIGCSVLVSIPVETGALP